ncbi:MULTISPECIES: MFS transporter [unclassified Rathayibacter]|uniref:MFS transporter n=1 Tax=unclassified Rathayibacter TaxID=2609250 RepID=UPI0006FBF338|nr:MULTISPECIES: MFS transporter [unclassified Rathayibacter]KQQ05943.1 MFS transporter permease [Rathayibacter sp. Leaf294]KQS13800.1 MFS transporter permease [Rathayibacter sp. Leaf185]
MTTRRNYAWMIFATTCVLSFVGFGLTLNTASIYWSSLSADLGVDLAQVSLMSSLSGIASAIALGVAAPLFTRINLKVFLSAMVVLMAAMYLLSATATDIATLYVANIVLGAAKAVAVMLPVPILLGNWFEKHLGTVTGIAGAMTAVGGAVFSPLIGSIISEQGWRTAYVVTAIVVLVVLLPFTLFVAKLRPTGEQRPFGHDPARQAETASIAMSGVSARRAFRSLPFACFALAGIALQFAGSLVQHLPTYLAATGLSLTIASSIYSVLLIGASVGKFAMGAAIDHLRPGVAVGLFTLIAVAGWGGLQLFPGELALSISSFAAGMAQAINLVAVVVLVRNTFGAREYSTILGPLLMLGSLANAGGVYVHGALFTATGSYLASFVVNVLLFVVSFALLSLAMRSGRGLAHETLAARPAAGPAAAEVADAQVATTR